METTRLSSKGRVIIPKALRDIYHWETGQELIAIDTGNGILLKPKQPFPKTQLEDVAGCLHYEGRAKTLDEMDEAIRQGLRYLFGLSNVYLSDSILMAQVIKWHETGLDFADALHLAKSKHLKEFYIFDRQFLGKASSLTQCAVKQPL